MEGVEASGWVVKIGAEGSADLVGCISDSLSPKRLPAAVLSYV